ncbi:competence protein CoiA family protein [Pseudomonas alliivorans]|nr:competence protein CoiA family protein [Pseudomonas alliivorans]
MKYSLLEGARVEATPKARGVCSFCGSQTVAKCGNHVVWHWAHKRLDNCDPWWETETAWHRDWKNMFPTEWQEVVLQASSGERHIADVRTPSGMVIEFQRSTIHPEEVIARQNYYQNMIWVIDGTRTEFDRYNFRMGLSKVSENGLASFSWHSRSKLFARWWVSKPVFIDFGPDFGIWRVLRFDPT